MRNAFLMLLLLNILAFAYQTWIIEPDNPVDALYIEQDVPGLLLAERPEPEVEVEAVPASEPAEPDESASQTAAVLVYRCLRIGPFARETDADKVQLSLQRREATVRQSAEPGRVWVGHWAQVADQGSRKKAEQTRDALIAKGISDAYILPGDADHRISLGVYRQRASADRIVKQASSLGLATLVQDRYQPGTNFWLRVRLPADQTLKPGEFKSDTGQILRTETIGCEDAGI
jgi:hypothetical protein